MAHATQPPHGPSKPNELNEPNQLNKLNEPKSSLQNGPNFDEDDFSPVTAGYNNPFEGQTNHGRMF
jgi:hypothetical protein